MKLGCIGDDFTGSSDLANTLAREGMRVVQFTGVPSGPVQADVDAGIVALKSRTAPAAEAVRASLAALDWLRAQGCTQFFFKYCSTFDSTLDGNIGPVIDALMERLDADACIVCPAFPTGGRSLYQGHLFVNGTLLSESGMESHPLTPMTDPDIRRWLGHQTRASVGLVPAATVFLGAGAIGDAIRREAEAGRPVVVVDAIRDKDLRAIGAAARTLKLVTGGSGVALGLPANFAANANRHLPDPGWTGNKGPAALIAGSASRMTRDQVARYAETRPALEIMPRAVMEESTTPGMAARFALESDRPALLFSSADPDTVRAAQDRYGREVISGRLESFFAETARALIAGGVTRLVVAGGETSGAVVEGLGLKALRIGPEIAPGVPAMRANEGDLVLALKSGNFGEEDFFAAALEVMEGET